MGENQAQTRQVNTSSETEQLLNGYGTIHERSPRHRVAVYRSLSDASGPDINSNVTYWGLLKTNREYRLLLSSYLITHCGEWLTYIASINVIELQMQKSNTTSRTAISILVAARLLPNVLLSLFGGTLADSRDRRKSMIFLDVCGAICALLFVVAYQLESVNLIYLMTFFQESIAGLYQPCSSSIIPLMVANGSALQKATILSGVAWSAMAAFGSAAGGFLVAAFGSRNCFCKSKIFAFA
jgi:MFS family permease